MGLNADGYRDVAGLGVTWTPNQTPNQTPNPL